MNTLFIPYISSVGYVRLEDWIYSVKRICSGQRPNISSEADLEFSR
jgi:hypothetical protein